MGESELTVRGRMNQYRSNIKLKNTQQYVHRHFIKDHSFNDFMVQPIEQVNYNGVIDKYERKNIRLIREDFWMRELRTIYPYGLNVEVRGYKLATELLLTPTGIAIESLFNKSNREQLKRGNRSKRTYKFEINSLSNIISEYDNNFDLNNNLNIYFQLRKFIYSMNKKQLKQINIEILNTMDIKVNYKEMILDMIKRKLQKSTSNKDSRNEVFDREVISMDFINKGMELVGISRIFHDKTVSCHLKIESPIISFKYDKPIRNKILNYQHTVIKTNYEEIDSVSCNCHKYIDSTYYNNDFKHVITGDMSFVQNDKLRLLLEKGPKYRNNSCIDWDAVLEEIMDKVDSFIAKHGKNHTINKVFINHNEWSDNIKIKVTDRINILRHKNNNFINTELLDNNTTNLLKELHEKYVLSLADKATGNVIIACKKHYLDINREELLGNNTYNEIDENEIKIRISNISNYCKTNKINCDEDALSYQYSNFKMHKEPVAHRFIVASAKCSIKSLAIINTLILKKILLARRSYCNTIYNSTKVNMMWIIDNNSKLVGALNNISELNKAESIETYDFQQLYTNIELGDLKEKLGIIITECCNRAPKYLIVNVNTKYAYWANSKSKNKNVLNLNKDKMISHINFLIDNIYFGFCKKFFQQIIGIPMGVDCGPLMANLYLHYYEFMFMNDLMNKNKNNLKIVKKFNNSFRFIDDLASINNKNFVSNIINIYPNTLKLIRQNDSDIKANYLDLDISISNNKFNIKVYDKRDNFNFDINCFPYIDSKINGRNMLNVYNSQLIRYARICTNINDFHDKHKHLCNKLIANGFKLRDLISKFKSFAKKYSNILLKWNYKVHDNWSYIKSGIIER